MQYEEWLMDVPAGIKNDPLWKFETYQKALFLADLVWLDCEKMLNDARGDAIARQLSRSGGSIAANIEEGYSRGFGKDYARFLRISLGSARESRGCYFRGRHFLSSDVINHRMHLLDKIISGLVQAAAQQKRY